MKTVPARRPVTTCLLWARVWLIGLALLLACAGAQAQAAESTARNGESPCRVTNDTGQDLYALFVALSGSGAWGAELLQGRVLAPGASVEVRLPYRGLWWDVRVENASGEALEWKNLPLRRVRGVALLLDNNRPGARTY